MSPGLQGGMWASLGKATCPKEQLSGRYTEESANETLSTYGAHEEKEDKPKVHEHLKRKTQIIQLEDEAYENARQGK